LDADWEGESASRQVTLGGGADDGRPGEGEAIRNARR